MRNNGPIALLFHTLVVTFVLAPLVLVCLVAFTAQDTLSLPFAGASLRWFKAVFDHPDFLQSFYNSLQLALLSATLSVCIALPAGLALGRYRFPGRDALNGLFLSPLIIPSLVPLVVPQGCYLAMGDNRCNSTDSSWWRCLP